MPKRDREADPRIDLDLSPARQEPIRPAPAEERPRRAPSAQTIPTLKELAKAEPAAVDGPMEIVPDHEFFLPVHGFVELTTDEVAVVNHPSFQRLGAVYQLGQTFLVFRGATHKRFEHVLGTLYVAQEMVAAVRANHRRAQAEEVDIRDCPLADPLSNVETVFVRLAALLHDIGHLPEGHTLEDELGFLDKHDKMDRLNKVFDRVAWPGGQTQSLRSVIDTTYGKWLQGGAISPSDLVIQIIAKEPPPDLREPAAGLIRVDVCRDIVGNTICADLLDYLHRDWYHIGKPKYFDRRLLQYMQIRSNPAGTPQFVVSLGSRPKIRTDAVTAILSLLESRYELAESVLFHRTKCAAAAMLERALYELAAVVPEDKRSEWLRTLQDTLLDQSDEGMIDFLLAEADRLGCQAAKLPLSGLRQRNLYKGLSTTFREELPGDVAKKLQGLYTGSSKAATARNEAVRMLERDFRLPSASLAIYCPEKGMNAKIADVRIHVNDCIETFRKWDEENNDILGAGHLKAQLDRFQSLWRVHIFLAQSTWNAMNDTMRQHLREAIRVCVLGRRQTENPLAADALRLATVLAQEPSSPYYQKEPKALVGTRSYAPDLAYPTGTPTIRSFFAEK